MYYLKTRYYDPITCRFINADGLIGANKGIDVYKRQDGDGTVIYFYQDDDGVYRDELGKGLKVELDINNCMYVLSLIHIWKHTLQMGYRFRQIHMRQFLITEPHLHHTLSQCHYGPAAYPF